MGRLDFRRPTVPSIPHHLHYDGNAIDGDSVEGIQHGLPTEPEVQAEPVECEPVDPLEFHCEYLYHGCITYLVCSPYIETNRMHRLMIK